MPIDNDGFAIVQKSSRAEALDTMQRLNEGVHKVHAVWLGCLAHPKLFLAAWVHSQFSFADPNAHNKLSTLFYLAACGRAVRPSDCVLLHARLVCHNPLSVQPSTPVSPFTTTKEIVTIDTSNVLVLRVDSESALDDPEEDAASPQITRRSFARCGCSLHLVDQLESAVGTTNTLPPTLHAAPLLIESASSEASPLAAAPIEKIVTPAPPQTSRSKKSRTSSVAVVESPFESGVSSKLEYLSSQYHFSALIPRAL